MEHGTNRFVYRMIREYQKVNGTCINHVRLVKYSEKRPTKVILSCTTLRTEEISESVYYTLGKPHLGRCPAAR